MARLTVHVQPRASRAGFAGRRGDALRVRLTAPPVDGAANKALTDFLAGALDVRRGDVTIVSGHTSRTKIVEISVLTDEEIAARLDVLLPGA